MHDGASNPHTPSIPPAAFWQVIISLLAWHSQLQKAAHNTVRAFIRPPATLKRAADVCTLARLPINIWAP